MTIKQKLSPLALATTLAIGSTVAPAAFAVDGLSANASMTSNYIWRGLTQTLGESAVQGGIDYAADSGLYVGTWVSNVNYGDDISYEHDIYFGFSGEAGAVSYDVGYLYYNYDDFAPNEGTDFADIYASVGIAGFSITGYVLAHTERDEAAGESFDFGETFYISTDYALEVAPELELGFHLGYHNDGDFNKAFNGVAEDYMDYNVTLAKGGFSFMASKTDIDEDEVAFVVAYSMDIDL